MLIPEVQALKEPEFVEQLFEVLDVDHSGTISQEELFGGVTFKLLGSPNCLFKIVVLAGADMKQKATLVFHAVDVNGCLQPSLCLTKCCLGDGKLTKQEIHAALRRAVYRCKLLSALQSARANNIPIDASYRKMAGSNFSYYL